jgi:hypothetical protein
MAASSTITGRGGHPWKRPTKPGLICEAEHAKRLGESLATRRRKKRVGIGPRYVQSGRQTLYPEDADVKYLIERVVDPEKPAPVHCDRPPKMRGAAP